MTKSARRRKMTKEALVRSIVVRIKTDRITAQDVFRLMNKKELRVLAKSIDEYTEGVPARKPMTLG